MEHSEKPIQMASPDPIFTTHFFLTLAHPLIFPYHFRLFHLKDPVVMPNSIALPMCPQLHSESLLTTPHHSPASPRVSAGDFTQFTLSGILKNHVLPTHIFLSN